MSGVTNITIPFKNCSQLVMNDYCKDTKSNQTIYERTGNCTDNNVSLKCTMSSSGLNNQCNLSSFSSTCNVTLTSNDTSQGCICDSPSNSTILNDTCYCVGLQSLNENSQKNNSLTIANIYNSTQCLCIPERWTSNSTYLNGTDTCNNSTKITVRTCNLVNEGLNLNNTSENNSNFTYNCNVDKDLRTFDTFTNSCEEMKKFNGSIYCKINNGTHIIQRNFNCLNGTEVLSYNTGSHDRTFLQKMWKTAKDNSIAASIIIAAIILGISYCICAKRSNKKIREEQRRKSMKRRSTRRVAHPPIPPQNFP